MPFAGSQCSGLPDSSAMVHVLIVFAFWSGLKQSPLGRYHGQSFLLLLFELFSSASVMIWQSNL